MAIKIRRRGRKKDSDFYTLIKNQSKLTLLGTTALVRYCQEQDKSAAELVLEYEKEADDARKLLVETLDRTFATPMDREDIFRVSSAIDDVIDYAKNTVSALKNYNVEPDEYVEKMSVVLMKIADGLYNAATLLQKDKKGAAKECYSVKKLENEANKIYMQALSKLFEEDNFKKILIFRELYRHLNNAADKGDNAADIFLNIIVKM